MMNPDQETREGEEFLIARGWQKVTANFWERNGKRHPFQTALCIELARDKDATR
jgi:hypothetical protein